LMKNSLRKLWKKLLKNLKTKAGKKRLSVNERI
jgi:hypothetical protein